MVSASQFCRNLLPVLQKSRPAVARNAYFRLESYVSIFGDHLIEEMVQLYKQDKKEEALSKFIQIVTHHEELVIELPQSIRTIYKHLNSAFTTMHSIELSKNLEDSSSKPPFSLQRDSELAEMFSADVLSHMPDQGEGKITNEDELIQILSNLGVFCKNNSSLKQETTSQKRDDDNNKNYNYDDDDEDEEEYLPKKKMACKMRRGRSRGSKRICKPMKSSLATFDDDDESSDSIEEKDVDFSVTKTVKNDIDEENVKDVVAVEDEKEEESDNESIQNQINDAYNLFF